MDKTRYQLKDFTPAFIGVAEYHARNSKELQEQPNGRTAKKLDFLGAVNAIYVPILATAMAVAIGYGPKIRASIESLLR